MKQAPPVRSVHQSLFVPPYPLLPLAVFAYFIACFVLHGLSPLHTGMLGDPDDYMRLNEVIAWMKGQGWYDLSQPRMSPGAHTVVHWSRLVDLPIALVALPFVKLLGLSMAALLASFLVPPALFILLMTLATILAQPLAGRGRANLASVMVLFAPVTLFNFTPGRVDHHGWQVLIAGFGIFALERMVNHVRGWQSGIVVAFLFASGLWIGTEALPWIILFVALLAAFSAWKGGFAARNAAFFGVSFAIAAALMVPLALPPSEFSSRALSWFSPGDAIFGGLTAALFLTSWFSGRHIHSRVLRMVLVAALGFFVTAVFCHLVPDALIGPFADYDNFNSGAALSTITEAQALGPNLRVRFDFPYSFVRAFVVFSHFLFVPTIALLSSVYFVCRRKREERVAWIIHSAFLLMALLMSVFWQSRVSNFMQFFAVAPVTALLGFAWDASAGLRQRPRFWAEIVAFFVLGPLPVVMIPAFVSAASFYPDVLLFPAARSSPSCSLKDAAAFLAQPDGFGRVPHTILAGANEGPEILFRTEHNVIAGNYNVLGNSDVFDFFTARDDKKARQIMNKWHADLVLVCRNISPFYAGFGKPRFGENIFLTAGKDGKLHLTGNPAQPPLIERLVNDKAPPWLKPVVIPDETDYLLFNLQQPQ